MSRMQMQQMGAAQAPGPAAAWRAYLLGVGAALPIVLGVFPFGVITGALAGALGMSWAQAVGMSAARGDRCCRAPSTWASP